MAVAVQDKGIASSEILSEVYPLDEYVRKGILLSDSNQAGLVIERFISSLSESKSRESGFGRVIAYYTGITDESGNFMPDHISPDEIQDIESEFGDAAEKLGYIATDAAVVDPRIAVWTGQDNITLRHGTSIFRKVHSVVNTYACVFHSDGTAPEAKILNYANALIPVK